MICTATWASVLTDAGFTLAAGVPCSSLSPLQDHLQATAGFTYVAAPNEGQAVAVAAGAVMAGQRALVLMQNSGLGNAVSPLTSLVETFRLPLVLVTSWRGQPGRPDEPQHFRMGNSTHALLDALTIPHTTLDAEGVEAARQLRWAIDYADRQRTCVALVVPDGVFEHGVFEPSMAPTELSPIRACGVHEDLTRGGDRLSRTEALDWLRLSTDPGTIRLTTTGKTGRELFALSDDPSNLYLVGSMGLSSSVGLGMSLSLPRKIMVIDGDGAALMHLGALPMIARYGGRSLLHVILDNGTYDSTGGQTTLSSHAPFSDIAARCGYVYSARVDDVSGLAQALSHVIGGPALIHVLVRPGSPQGLPRPSLAPPEILARLRDHFEIRQ